MLKPANACRLDSESEKITNFFNFERRITSIARNKAYSSARKMLVRSGSRTLLVIPLYTIAEATRSPALEPSATATEPVHYNYDSSDVIIDHRVE